MNGETLTPFQAFKLCHSMGPRLSLETLKKTSLFKVSVHILKRTRKSLNFLAIRLNADWCQTECSGFKKNTLYDVEPYKQMVLEF